MDKKNIVVGIHPVRELISSDEEIEKILISRDFSSSELSEISKLAKDKDISVQKVPKIKLDKLSDINHQGVLAFISPISYVDIDDIIEYSASRKESPLILILDSVTDTRNFGAICRTAECMGVHGIIVPRNHTAALTEGAIKSSAGAILKLKISRINHLLDAVYHLQASNIPVVCCSEKADTDLRKFRPNSSGLALIMGAEDRGIHPKIIQASDDHIKITMFGTIESLNVGVAAGMILYEVKSKLNEAN